MRLLFIAGARPNFMKIAPLIVAAQQAGIDFCLIHTGQHYDRQMSDLFFRDLGIPEPQVNFGIGTGSPANQIGRVIVALDEFLDQTPVDGMVVVGDVNSTLASALVASKRAVPLAHVEAGLRSGDRSMPEEVNRILTDQLADYLFTTERSAADNLTAEGVPQSKIFFVGNVMIDSLLKHRDRARKSQIVGNLQLKPKQYAVVTFHRPANVDNLSDSLITVAAITRVAHQLPTVLPLHPRTRAAFERFDLIKQLATLPRLQIIEPLGYLDFLSLMDQAKLVVTDSGGVQEETTVLQVPCLTFRDNTERPITVTEGTNHIVGRDVEKLATALLKMVKQPSKPTKAPELWDGKAANRIINILQANLTNRR